MTAKCDVYSSGIVLLELLAGRRALDKIKIGLEQNLVDWAKPYLGDRRKMYRIMDTNLQGQYSQKEAFMVGLVASQCISEAKLRPTMSEILSILEDLPRAKYGTSPSLSDIQILCSPSSWSPLLYNEYSPRDSPLPEHIDPRESPLPKLRDSTSKLDSRESPLPKFRDSPPKLDSRESPLPKLRYSPSKLHSRESPLPKLRNSPYKVESRESPLPRLIKSPSNMSSKDSPLPQYISYSKGSPLPSYYVNFPR